MAAIASPAAEEDIEDAPDVVKMKPHALRAQKEAENDRGGRAGLTTSANGEVPSMLEDVSLDQPPRTNSDSDGSGSQTVLIRDKAGRESAPAVRLESMRLSSRIDFTQTDTFKVSGKTCTVALEEDRITWAPKKASGKECLYLSDVFAIVPGPNNPPSRSHGPRRLSSSSIDSCCEFTIHALKSMPNSPGALMRVTFKSTKNTSVSDACEVWTQQIKHQLQNFGNRPRRLYVVVNPASGEGTALRVWNRVERLFQLTHITTELMFTQRQLYAREVLQSCDLSQYDGVVVVGGDGTVNEVINALVMQAQHQSGVNTRRSRFAPVSVNQRLGIIPAGMTNTIARSVLGCQDPNIAAAQIMLGCNTPMDVSSISHKGQLVLFSAGIMAYGFWSDMNLFSQDFSWLGSRRYEAAMLRTLLSHKSFEAELSYVPVEEPEAIMEKRERCFSRCNKCANFDCSLESPASASHKGASVLATYTEEDTIDQKHWKKISGRFSNVMVCPHVCSTHYAPLGFSPYGHLGNGCTDIVLLRHCSKMSHARWLLRQKKSRDLFNLPYLQILRVKEFKFHEIPRRRTLSEERDHDRSVDNLMQDDDEMTNRRGETLRRREQEREGGGGARGGDSETGEASAPTSRWNIDGSEISNSDIELRVHRHLISVLARGMEPTLPPLDTESSLHDNHIRTAGHNVTEQERAGVI